MGLTTSVLWNVIKPVYSRLLVENTFSVWKEKSLTCYNTSHGTLYVSHFLPFLSDAIVVWRRRFVVYIQFHVRLCCFFVSSLFFCNSSIIYKRFRFLYFTIISVSLYSVLLFWLPLFCPSFHILIGTLLVFI